MGKKWEVTYFEPKQPGILIEGNKVRFTANLLTDKECGVILYDRRGNQTRFPFHEKGKRGTLYGLAIEGEGLSACTYNFYEGNQVITDPYAREIHGLEKWGSGKTKKRRTCGVLARYDFDWQADKPLMIPLEDSIFYGLNVRAFTMHRSSGVKHRGTFEGIIEKIPYFKELGISAVELMPCYEYDECMVPENPAAQPFPAPDLDAAAHTFGADLDMFSTDMARAELPLSPENTAFSETALKCKDKPEIVRLNCWGFQKGFYFSPKAAYSAVGSPVLSFKNMVYELHQNGIEVIMQFYFPLEIGQLYMLDVIKYWVLEYHIDGVRINGFRIPVSLFAEEPVLKNTKIWCDGYRDEDLPAIANPLFKNFLANNGNFRNDMRRFLKGDVNLMNQMAFYQRRNPAAYGVVNYLADYDGFSLYDSVSYGNKHNEANGEDNRDGTNDNFSWNCGVEGHTRKKAVLTLRQKQIKNALSFVLLAQGVPFIFSGDEFGASRNGNNNCYCQDNETGWINWKNNSFSREIFSYARFLINLRRKHPILHMKEELKIMDYKGYGFPDLSYHGTEAWRPDFSYISQMMGIVLCGQYAPDKEDDSFYIACNMHWSAHKLALPKLNKNEKWIKIADTSLPCEQDYGEENDAQENSVISISGRTMAIFKAQASKETEGKPQKGSGRNKRERKRK